MGIKTFKPTSPARRFYSSSDFKEITKGAEPEKSLLEHQTRTGGRNHHGRITKAFMAQLKRDFHGALPGGQFPSPWRRGLAQPALNR